MGITRITSTLKRKRANNPPIKIKAETKWISTPCNKINAVVKIIPITAERTPFNAAWIVDEFLICYSKSEQVIINIAGGKNIPIVVTKEPSIPLTA